MRDYDGLFSRLLSDLGFQAMPDGHIFSDMSPQDAAKVALANSFYKKLCPMGNTKEADAAALEKFERINASLPDSPVDFIASNEAESCFYDYFKNNLAVALQPEYAPGVSSDSSEIEETFNLDFIREHMMVGPGAAQKADATSMVHKLFYGEMSHTNPYLISVYRSAVAATGFWADAEKARFERFGFTPVKGGKLFFAPKNAEISRTCCTESNLGLLLQMAAGAFLELRLKRHFGISLSEQPDNNRELARIGSIDGSKGTIDLVSASDSIGLQRFLQYFPTGFLKTIMLASRSETAVLPDGRDVVLRMISTMGNGFTFPLQTVIFASVVRAVYQLMGKPCYCPKTQFGVFGDDIIVDSDAYDFVCAMLVKLGFEVNVRKSFNTGLFRESCGHDYVAGVNIRGVYCVSLETPQQIYSTINRLLRWGAEHSCYLKTTLQLLRSWVRDLRVPISEADDAGIKVPSKLMPSTKVDNAYWYRYRCYVRRIQRVELDEPDSEPLPFNPDGIAVGFLSGHFRRRDYVLKETDLSNPGINSPWASEDGWSYSVAIRDKIGARARYKIAHKSIPWWDYQLSTKNAGSFSQGMQWRAPLTGCSYDRWEADVVATLDTCLV